MLRVLLWVISAVLGVAPAGVGVGVGLATAAGWGLASGSGAYLLLAGWLLVADVAAPPAARREVAR